jgi:hypothetical protein
VDAPGRVIGQAGEHVGEPGLGIDVVELGGGDQRIDGGGAPAAFIGSGEGPVLAADGDSTYLAFSGVVGVRRQRSLDRPGGLNKGEFLAHRNVHRSEDETANPTIEGTG